MQLLLFTLLFLSLGLKALSAPWAGGGGRGRDQDPCPPSVPPSIQWMEAGLRDGGVPLLYSPPLPLFCLCLSSLVEPRSVFSSEADRGSVSPLCWRLELALVMGEPGVLQP